MEGEGKLEIDVDRRLRLDQIQEGIDALANEDLVGRAVLLPPFDEAS